MKTVTVNVTQEDIEKGCKTSFKGCAIARAVARACCRNAEVGCGGEIYFEGSNGPVADSDPIRAAFILAFDSGLPVEPFSFEIQIPEGAV